MPAAVHDYGSGQPTVPGFNLGGGMIPGGFNPPGGGIVRGHDGKLVAQPINPVIGQTIPNGGAVLPPTFAFTPNPLGRPPIDSREDDRLDREFQSRVRSQAIENNWQQARIAAQSAEQRLEIDLWAVNTYNLDAKAVNDRVLPVLMAFTDKNFGGDRLAWSQWWANERGYVESPQGPKPTLVERVEPVYTPQFVPVPPEFVARRLGQSCFAAGTRSR